MHFKNGREARNADPVIGRNQYSGEIIVGNIGDLNPGSTQCNCTVYRAFGGPISCATVGDIYHAEDALKALEALQSSAELLATRQEVFTGKPL